MDLRKVLIASIVVLAILARLVPGPRTIDDSFITFRYARNILVGEGFVYNPDARVLGTTTPLYTGLIVGLALFSGGVDAPFAELAWLLNTVLDGLTCLLLIRLGGRTGFEIAGLAIASVWAVLPYSVTFAIGGLETSLIVLLLSGAAYAALTSRYVWAAALASGALLTRPDALLLIAPIAIQRLATASNLPFARQLTSKNENVSGPLTAIEVGAFVIPGTLWGGFAWLYFGSPIPHSITAKAAAYQLGDLDAFIRLLQHYATPFTGQLTFGNPWIGIGLVLYPFLFLIGARALLRDNQRLWPWLLYPWLYFAVYALANPLIFRWYLTPPLPAYLFVILAGLQQLLGLFRRASKDQVSQMIPAAWLKVAVFGLPLLLVLRGWTLHPDHGLDRPAPEMAWYDLELQYRKAAATLVNDPSVSKSAVLAAGDVGVLGFDTAMQILDTVGLNSPQAIRYYPTDPSYYVNAYAVSPQLILDQQPDFVILLEVYGREGLFKNADFLTQYRLRDTIDTAIYGSEGMLIYERITVNGRYTK